MIFYPYLFDLCSIRRLIFLRDEILKLFVTSIFVINGCVQNILFLLFSSGSKRMIDKSRGQENEATRLNSTSLFLKMRKQRQWEVHRKNFEKKVSPFYINACTHLFLSFVLMAAPIPLHCDAIAIVLLIMSPIFHI